MKSPTSQANKPAQKLAATLQEAVALLDENVYLRTNTDASQIKPQPALLQQCLQLCDAHRPAEPEPIRTIHHFACTGGTLISRCLAVMPNVQLLSEVDPFNTLMFDPTQPRFAPTDAIMQLRQSTRGTNLPQLTKIFIEELRLIYQEAVALGQRLVLRDHAHGHFCVGDAVPVRPALRELVSQHFPTKSVVTVRHPIDSFLSLVANEWLHFEPPTLDQYCNRYMAFLDVYSDVPVFKYEDFIEEPEKIMADICSALSIAYRSEFTDIQDAVVISGDAGRSGGAIQQRDRRGLPEEIAEEAKNSEAFRRLCGRLGYSPDS